MNTCVTHAGLSLNPIIQVHKES